jgi:tetratricopeptide (TPR) repeat protein
MSISLLSAQDLQSAFSESYNHEFNKEYVLAIESINEVYTSNNYEVNLRLGWLYYLSGEQVKSVKHYNFAIDLMPYSIEAKLGLAYPLGVLGSWNKVVSLYNQILEIDAHNSIVNYRLASINYSRNEFAAAKEYLLKVINLYPFDYDSNILLAWTFLELGDKQKAKVFFEKVLLINPNDESANLGLSKIN